MKSMSISEFKTHALHLIDQIVKTREGLIITKRGKPVVEVLAYRETTSKPQAGKLAAYLVFEKDIVSPLGEEIWEASR